jgi:mono/diheme cytochrome c family protein
VSPPASRATGRIALLAALAAGCATTGGPAGPALHAEGERLYRSHCAACHRLRDPSEHTRERWAWALEKYGPKAHLAPQERPVVLRYLEASAADR